MRLLMPIQIVAMVVFFFGLAAVASAQDAFSPVAEWRMDEDRWVGTAGEVVDSVSGLNGRARTGGNDGSLPSTEPAQVCNGGRFRGEGFNDPDQNNAYTQARHYVEIPDAGDLSPLSSGEPMTFTGWFQPETSSSSGVLIHKGEGGTSQEYRVRVGSDRLELALWDQYGSAISVQTGSLNLTGGDWYFFEATATEGRDNRVFIRISVLDDSLNLLSSRATENSQFFNRPDPGDYFDKPFDAPLLFGAQRFGQGSTPVNYVSGVLDEVRLHNQYFGTLEEFQSIASVMRQCGDPLSCFNDDYTGGQLNPDDWVASVASGPFTPEVVDGRLRMTEAASNQSTAITLQREIPGADNLVILEFDYYAYGGSGADGISVVLSDALVTPQPGSFGGSLGYAQRNNGDPGFAGGWLGIGLDEFGNFSNPTEGRQGGPGFRRDAVAIRGAEQGEYRFLRGTGTLATGIDQPGNDPSAHRYRITVDSRNTGDALVSVERDVTGTGNNFQELIAPFNALNESGQPAVPENFLLSLTGSTGGSTNIHELDNVELCALELNPVGEQVDHFEILHDGVALTCQPETVTIRACANEDCDQLFTDPVQATLAPSDGWQGGNVVNIDGGFGEATLQNTVAGEATLDVIGSEPSTRPQAVTLCQAGGGPLSAANCVLEFFDSGLAFDVPDLTSHKPSRPVEVRAVRRDDETQACVPAFENVERSVQFWSTYVDPDDANRPVSRALAVDGEDVSGDPGAPTTVDLDFGAGGIAEIDVRYPDAGRMQLDGRYQGSEATEDEGLVMPGSDQFVSVPAGLCVRTDGECAAGDASCPLFARAGEDFDLSITAVGWQSDGDSDLCEGNPVTPNFRLLDVPLSSEVRAPSGGVDGAITPTSYSHTRSADATEIVSARVSEVGVFEFQATPATGGYQGLTVPQGTSAPAGRFYPDRFGVMVDPGELAAECTVATPFSYTGQDIDWSLVPSLEIEPLSVQGARTFNYTEPGFQRLSAADVARTLPVGDSTASNLDDGPLAVTANAVPGLLTVAEQGLLQFNYSTGDSVRYNKLAEARVAPIEPDLEYIVTDITDADGVSGEGAPYEFTPAADFDVRYGRLTMDNVYGPENIPELLMPFRLEYWNGSRFVVNAADSCTPWTTGDITSPAEHHTLAADSGTFSGGETGPLSLQPDGSQGTDTLTWAVPDWLRDDIDEDGTLEDPSALATFGVYRGHDRVIYWREK